MNYLLSVIIFIILNGYVRSQNVLVEPNKSVLVEMNDQLNLTCYASKSGPIEACNWVWTDLDKDDYDYDELMEKWNLPKKFPCLVSLYFFLI